MSGKRGSAIAACLMMISTVFVGMAAAADDVSKEDGTTTADAFGPDVPAGMEYARVKSPSGDSWVAVIWGKGTTELNKGGIWIVGMWTRYLGTAKVYDQNGALTARSKPLAVRGYFMQSFNAIYEFNDTNGDGIANVLRANKPITAAQVIAHEPVYKAASLRTGWDRTNSSETCVTLDGHPAKLWELTLTAHDMPYIVIGDTSKVNQSVGDWKLNSVSFTFHLWGWKENVNVSVPLFNITVDKSTTPVNITTVPAGTKDFSANLTKVRAKEDHSITGWDFDPSNAHPGIVLETHFAYGYFVWSRAPAWLAALYIENVLGGAGKTSYQPDGAAAATTVDGGNDSLPDADGAASDNDTVQKVGSNRRVEFAGNWEKEGALTWTSDTSIWAANDTTSPSTGTVAFQVQGARRFAWNLGVAGGLKFIGIFLMGGFSYTGGPFYKVEHDPQTDMEMGDVNIPDQDNSPPVARASGPSGDVSYKDTPALNGSASSDPENDQLTYKWTEGLSVLGTGAVLSQAFQIGGHTVNLTVDDSGSSNTTAVTFNVVNKKPAAKILALSKTKFMTTDKIKLDASGSSDPENETLTYEWKDGTKVIGSTATLSKNFSKGSHTVTLTVTDPKGGTDSATTTFTVEEKKTPGFQALFFVFGLGAAMVLLSRRKR